MEEALYDAPRLREFAGLYAGEDNLPDDRRNLARKRLLISKDCRHLKLRASVHAEPVVLTILKHTLREGIIRQPSGARQVAFCQRHEALSRIC